MNDITVRMIVSVGSRSIGDEFKVSWFIAMAMVRDGFAVIIKEESE